MIGVPSRLRLIRKAAALARMFPHFDFSIEAKYPRSNCADLQACLFIINGESESYMTEGLAEIFFSPFDAIFFSPSNMEHID